MAEKIIIKTEEYYYNDPIFKSESNLIKVFVEEDYDKRLHQQEFYEINIITKGSGIHIVEDNQINVKTGDIFVIPPNVAHGYKGGEGFDVYHILINDYFMRKYYTELQQLPNFFILFAAEPIMRASTRQPLYLSPNKEQFQETTKLLNEMLIYKDLEDTISNMSKAHLCMLFICKMCEIYSQNKDLQQNINSNFDESFMNSISYIHENFTEKITIEKLCEIAHLSRSTYIRKFKRICKMPPFNYIYKCKVEAAKNMLANTNFSISEIAFKTGFYDAAHLTKSFETELGISPSNYRKQNK